MSTAQHLIDQGIEKGLQKGLVKGCIDKIRLMERFLGKPQNSDARFATASTEELESIYALLEQEYKEKFKS